LLKILSRITEPTGGRVEMDGRVGSLLEVGTGFHPELTGRENVYLSGAILGMRRDEINRRFDEIVDFSGVEKFIDTPFKRYSSGMQVRLAFAVAAYLETEILLIDEVLAVGDAEFQNKCLGRMEQVSGSGRTVLFVSHNLGAITSICQHALILNSGVKYYQGLSGDAIEHYMALYEDRYHGDQLNIESPKGTLCLLEAYPASASDQPRGSFGLDEEVSAVIKLRIYKPIANVAFGITITTMMGEAVLTSYFGDTRSQGNRDNFEPGDYKFNCRIPAFFLNEHRYYVGVSIHKPGMIYISEEKIYSFTIEKNRTPFAFGNRAGVVNPMLNWTLEMDDKDSE